MNKMAILQSLAPDCDQVTTYDRNCFNIYLQLLDADRARVPWKTAYETIFDEEIGIDLDAAKTRYETHLKRAKWISANGYSQLI